MKARQRMSKINIVFDTVSKACSVMMDGTEVEGWEHVSLCKYGDTPSIEISKYKKDKENGVYEMTRTCAAEKSFASWLGVK